MPMMLRDPGVWRPITKHPHPTNRTIVPTAIPSQRAVGTPTLYAPASGRTMIPAGVASGAALGVPTLSQPATPTNRTMIPTGIASARALGTPSLSQPLSGFPTTANTGLTGVGMTVADLDDNGGAGWRGFDFYGAPNGSIWTGYDIWASGSIMEFPSSDAGKTITFKKCRIMAGTDGDPWAFWGVLNENGVNLVFEDCDMYGGQDSAISGSNYTLRRCRVHGGGDGLKFASDVLIEDSYIDAYIPTTGDPHADGAQSLGTDGDGTEGSGATLRHNTIWMGAGATSCIILSTGSADQMRDVLIDNNLFRGGVYSVYGGYQAGTDTLSKVSNIIVRNNAFSTTLYPTGGNSGPMTSVDSPAVSHTGNYWFDGPNTGMAID